MPAEMIRPYVPVSGPALGVELGELEALAVGLVEGEANGFGDWEPLDPPPQEITNRAANIRIAPWRIRPNFKAARRYEASFFTPFGPGHAG
jgi:hypothetical protein